MPPSSHETDAELAPDRQPASAPSRLSAAAALLLLVPAPSIGTLFGMILFPDTALGMTVFAVSKVWLFGLPVAWHVLVDRKPVSGSPPRRGGFGMGLASGLLISAAIVLGYVSLGRALIDPAVLVKRMNEVGLGSPGPYLAGAAYWILINSVLEEYVWRWFCFRKCEALMPARPAVVLAGLLFTLHHIVALQVYMGPLAVALCSLGVFVGGAFWSWMYLKYRSIWPAYLSHAIVDVAVFAIGGWMLFSAAAS